MARRSLKDKRIVLTGATSGIGQALALELAARGGRLLVNGRRENRLQALQTQIQQRGGACDFVAGDITQVETRQRILEACRSSWGALDVLINCAGIGAMGPFLDAQPERLRRIFEVNFFAAAEMIRSGVPLLEAGTLPLIVNVSSVLGHRAVPNKSEYCASKFAVHGFSDALRAEFSGRGIDVLLVSPSTTDSEFFDAALEDQLGKDWKGSRAMAPATVARRAASAMERGVSEVILSWGGWGLVWLDRLAPGLANYLVARFGQ